MIHLKLRCVEYFQSVGCDDTKEEMQCRYGASEEKFQGASLHPGVLGEGGRGNFIS